MADTLSEREVISRYFQPLATFPGAFDLLDDCAELAPAPGQAFVFKTDPIRAGVHFFAEDDPADIAWKALAVGVSDLAAKSARPVAYLLAVSFADAPQAHWLQAFSDGLRAAQDAFGAALIGGDTDRADGPMTIAATLIGEVPVGRMIHRGGARVGDLLYVTGALGEAGVGLGFRAAELGAAVGPDTSGLDPDIAAAARARYLRPEPRLGMKAALRRYATAAMDISDGLALDVDRLVTASSHFGPDAVGCEIEVARLPVAASVQTLASAQSEHLQLAVGHGDDYEVLATVGPTDAAAFEDLSAKGGVSVTEIGRITATPGVAWHSGDGQRVDVSALGYQHFRAS
ncbi:MAG: thiamine-phosphate kinase [Pseudomonadota bacterium]